MSSDQTPPRPEDRARDRARDRAGSSGDEPAVVRNPTEASQGAPAGRVRWVVILGLLLAVIGYIVVYFATRP